MGRYPDLQNYLWVQPRMRTRMRAFLLGLGLLSCAGCDKTPEPKTLIGPWCIDVPSVGSHILYTFAGDRTYTLGGAGPPMNRTNVVTGTWALKNGELTMTAHTISNKVTGEWEPFSSTQTLRVWLRGDEMVWSGGERVTLGRSVEPKL